LNIAEKGDLDEYRKELLIENFITKYNDTK